MKQWTSFWTGAAILTMAATAGAADRSYVSGYFQLDLDGVKSGLLQSVSGGAISADVLEQPGPSDYFVKKHIGQPKYEEFAVELGFSDGKKVLDWISETFDGKSTRRNGAIVAADFNYKERSRREFHEAVITQVTLPACDAESKDPAFMTLKFKPELIRSKPPGSGKLSSDAKQQKLWLPSNFRLNIPGIDCKRVQKIEAFTIKQKVASSAVGEVRDYEIEPTSVEFPNLRLLVPATGVQDFVAWHEDFVIQGNNSEENEKTGELSFLSPNRAEELARVSFKGLGIFRVEQLPARGNSVAQFVVDLYVERMEIDFMAQFEN